jgi:hypothetical protein
MLRALELGVQLRGTLGALVEEGGQRLLASLTVRGLSRTRRLASPCCRCATQKRKVTGCANRPAEGSEHDQAGQRVASTPISASALRRS